MPWVEKSEYERLKYIESCANTNHELMQRCWKRLADLKIWLVQQAIDVPNHLTGYFDEDDECNGNEPPIEEPRQTSNSS